MIIVVGLGNPGRKYAGTRHNVGFMVADCLADKLKTNFTEKEDYLLAKAKIDDKDILIVKPTTYMNLSGRAVKRLVDSRILQSLPESLIVIQDDLDLDVGKIKIRKNGSSGGHRGVQSIIEALGTKNFLRIKIGIGKDPSKDPADYVLSPFTKTEKSIIKEKIDLATDAIVTIVTDGVDRAMNIYNRTQL